MVVIIGLCGVNCLNRFSGKPQADFARAVSLAICVRNIFEEGKLRDTLEMMRQLRTYTSPAETECR